MRSRLSYYSVILLVGLAITSGLILAMNPFNPLANASAPAQGASPAGGAVATNSTVSSTTSTPAPGGILAGVHHHHHDSEFPGAGSGVGNSTVTTTPSGIYSDHE